MRLSHILKIRSILKKSVYNKLTIKTPFIINRPLINQLSKTKTNTLFQKRLVRKYRRFVKGPKTIKKLKTKRGHLNRRRSFRSAYSRAAKFLFSKPKSHKYRGKRRKLDPRKPGQTAPNVLRAGLLRHPKTQHNLNPTETYLRGGTYTLHAGFTNYRALFLRKRLPLLGQPYNFFYKPLGFRSLLDFKKSLSVNAEGSSIFRRRRPGRLLFSLRLRRSLLHSIRLTTHKVRLFKKRFKKRFRKGKKADKRLNKKLFFKLGYKRTRRRRRFLTKIYSLQNLLPLVRSCGNITNLFTNFFLLSTGNSLLQPVYTPRPTTNTPRNQVRPYLFLGERVAKPKTYLTKLLRGSLNRLLTRRPVRRSSKLRKFKLRRLFKRLNNKRRQATNHSIACNNLPKHKFNYTFRFGKLITTSQLSTALCPIKPTLRKVFEWQPGYNPNVLPCKVVGIKIRGVFSPKTNYFYNMFTSVQVTPTNLINGLSTGASLNLVTRVSTPFILLNYGLFVRDSFRLSSPALDYNNYKYKFKKNYFSFLYPNQLKRSILMRKKRVLVSRFFLKSRFNKLRSFRFSTKPFLTTFKSLYLNKLKGSSLRNSVFSSKNTNYLNFKQNIFYRNDFSVRGSDESFKVGEVFIPRVRFKPGYQRLWRLARLSLKESLGLKYTYQYRLTRYLSRFSRQTHSYFLNFSEMSVEKVTLYSKLLPNTRVFSTFVGSKLLFLNGHTVVDGGRVVFVNDLLQLIVSKWYYVYSRWLSNWTVARVRKFKYLAYRKGLASRYKLMKAKKQRSRYTPNWIFNVRYDILDVKPYLEVDYFTLSSFVLYEPYLLTTQHINDLPEARQNTYRLYNWKYIT